MSPRLTNLGQPSAFTASCLSFVRELARTCRDAARGSGFSSGAASRAARTDAPICFTNAPSSSHASFVKRDSARSTCVRALAMGSSCAPSSGIGRARGPTSNAVGAARCHDSGLFRRVLPDPPICRVIPSARRAGIP
jgi:hypothetical protein